MSKHMGNAVKHCKYVNWQGNFEVHKLFQAIRQQQKYHRYDTDRAAFPILPNEERKNCGNDRKKLERAEKAKANDLFFCQCFLVHKTTPLKSYISRHNLLIISFF